jgi:hypothetical protein
VLYNFKEVIFYIKNWEKLLIDAMKIFNEYYDKNLTEWFNIVTNKFSNWELLEWLLILFTYMLWWNNEKLASKKWNLIGLATFTQWEKNIVLFNSINAKDTFFKKLKWAVIYND